jgi:hypothetical protein
MNFAGSWPLSLAISNSPFKTKAETDNRETRSHHQYSAPHESCIDNLATVWWANSEFLRAEFLWLLLAAFFLAATLFRFGGSFAGLLLAGLLLTSFFLRGHFGFSFVKV